MTKDAYEKAKEIDNRLGELREKQKALSGILAAHTPVFVTTSIDIDLTVIKYLIDMEDLCALIRRCDIEIDFLKSQFERLDGTMTGEKIKQNFEFSDVLDGNFGGEKIGSNF